MFRKPHWSGGSGAFFIRHPTCTPHLSRGQRFARWAYQRWKETGEESQRCPAARTRGECHEGVSPWIATATVLVSRRQVLVELTDRYTGEPAPVGRHLLYPFEILEG